MEKHLYCNLSLITFRPETLILKHVVSCEICEIVNIIYFEEHLRKAASTHQ